MLEANPATMVTASSARSRSAGWLAAMTTGNAASYRLAALAQSYEDEHGVELPGLVYL